MPSPSLKYGNSCTESLPFGLSFTLTFVPGSSVMSNFFCSGRYANILLPVFLLSGCGSNTPDQQSVGTDNNPLDNVSTGSSESIESCIDIPDFFSGSVVDMDSVIGPTPTIQVEGEDDGIFEASGAADRGKLWTPGQTIRIRFLSGSPSLRDRVFQAATIWESFANIDFEVVDSGYAEIRIDFDPRIGGYWSAIGTDSIQRDQADPTMNYGGFNDNTKDQELQRVVLHEFGHALGLIHEHQSPAAGIPWNRQAVISELSGPPNYWSEFQIEQQVFNRYSDDIISEYTEFDTTSIMVYPIPNSWTLGDYSVSLNTALSSTDTKFIQHLYPNSGIRNFATNFSRTLTSLCTAETLNFFNLPYCLDDGTRCLLPKESNLKFDHSYTEFRVENLTPDSEGMCSVGNGGLTDNLLCIYYGTTGPLGETSASRCRVDYKVVPLKDW